MQPRTSGVEAGQWKAGLRLAVLPTLIAGALAPHAYAAELPAAALPAAPAAPKEVTFENDFFPSGLAPKVDLSRFEKGNVVLPGIYRGDVYFNNEWKTRTDIRFANPQGSDTAAPCFSASMLKKYGVSLKSIAQDVNHPAKQAIPASGDFCGPLGDYIPDATATFDSADQSLHITVPQIYTDHNARGYVDPADWDAGVNAFVLNYNANLYRNKTSGYSETSGYLGLNAALDLGSWHAIHQGALSWTQHQNGKYQNSATYLQHDIPAIMATMQAGQIYTSGRLFDSVRLEGVRLFTEERMLPQSQRGYAPVIRGVAETNARVQIKQRGYVIYETTVAPGPFSIDDLYPTGFGGDLDVEILEADGRKKQIVVPYAAAPQLLRKGQYRWEVAAGRAKQQNYVNAPNVVQATYQRGLSNAITGYAGVALASGYRAALVGGAFNTDVGAFSADITQAHTQVPSFAGTTTGSSGTSLRLGYNKNIDQTGTNIGLAAYRYSTKGFVGLNDYVAMRNVAARGLTDYTIARPRSQLDLNLYQQLGKNAGQVFVTGSARNYWGQKGKEVTYSAGYSNSWKSVSYSFTAQRTRDTTQALPGNPFGIGDVIPGVDDVIVPAAGRGRTDTSYFFTVSVPLGTADKRPMLSALYNHSQLAGGNMQLGINGTAGDHDQYSYSANASHSRGDTSAGVYGQYQSSHGNLSAGYSHGSGYQQASAGITGALILHAGGYTFTPPTGETLALVHAPGAAGARVDGGQGSRIDDNGWAVVPNLMPYENNVVDLDPKGLPADVELKDTQQNVAPRAGSVVRLEYQSVTGRSVLIDSSLPDGRPLPFGADVMDDAGNSVGIAGQGGRIFVRGLEKADNTLTVKWGSTAADSCQLHVALTPLPAGKHQDKAELMQAACVPVASSAAPAATPATMPATPAATDRSHDERAPANDGWSDLSHAAGATP